jgi:phasin family protein
MSTDAERETIKTIRAAAIQTEQIGRTMSNTAEQTARAASKAFRQNAETFSSNWRESSEAANRIAERSMDQFSKICGLNGDNARQSVEQSAASVQTLLDSSTVVASGIQNVSGEWMRFVQKRVEENLRNFDDLMNCRSIPDCMAIQTRMMRDNFEAFLQTARRTSELSTKLADDAVKQMSDAA